MTLILPRSAVVHRVIQFVLVASATPLTLLAAAGPQETSSVTSNEGQETPQAAAPLAGPRFVDNGDGTVSDTLTGLIWLRDASCAELEGTDSEGRGDWHTAANAVAGLRSGICGLSDGSALGDWRLPRNREFCSQAIDAEFWCPAEAAATSLVNGAMRGPALANAQGDGKWTDGDPFVDVKSGRYWSEAHRFHNIGWFIDLSDGRIFYGYRADKELFVWPVREP